MWLGYKYADVLTYGMFAGIRYEYFLEVWATYGKYNFMRLK